MQNILLSVHLVVALLLIGAVLMQRSEGGALGIGGGSGSLFSSRGAGSAVTRATAVLAAIFFATSIALTLVATRTGTSVLDSVTTTQQNGDVKATDEVQLPKLGGETAPATPQVPTGQ
jgi:preprotein translocase subunit SecG